ncbi:hypothetical protein ACE6H2_017492 [Prunus campanulata]
MGALRVLCVPCMHEDCIGSFIAIKSVKSMNEIVSCSFVVCYPEGVIYLL